ncbi:hypothetical protein MRY82_03835 [bacterium]|nr:hypothetical protein [bacterium]
MMLRAYLKKGLSLFSVALLVACGNNSRQQAFLLGQSNFTIEVLTEENECNVSFQLSNLIQQQIILVEASLWLKNEDQEFTRLKVWNDQELLDLLSGDQILQANAVQAYSYDFSPHIVTAETDYSLELQIIGLNRGLPSVAQILSFCEVS